MCQLRHVAGAFGSGLSCTVTGGLGGLGLLTAAWSLLSGAGGTVLLGRSTHPAAVEAARQAVGGGISVAVKCDAAFVEDTLGAADVSSQLGMRSCGVFHAAGLQVGEQGVGRTSVCTCLCNLPFNSSPGGNAACLEGRGALAAADPCHPTQGLGTQAGSGVTVHGECP